MPNLVDIVIGAKDETGPAVGSVMQSFKNLGTGAALGIAGVTAAVGGLVGGAYAIGSNFDEAFDKIRVQTGKTGDDLNGLTGLFMNVVSDVPADFGDAADAIGKLSSALDLDGQPLQNLTEQILNLSHITKTDVNTNIEQSTKLFNNWGVAAADQGDTLDFLFRTTQQTGIGFNELSQEVSDNGVKMRELGFSVVDTAAFFGSLHKAGIDASSVMPAFSKEMATAAKEGKSANVVLYDTFNTIKKAPTDTAAAAAAMQVFGAKAGPQLAAAIREGKVEVGELQAAIGSGTETINGAAADTEDFAEKWKKFTNQLQVAVEPVATRVFNAVGKVMDDLGPKLQELSMTLNDQLAGAVQTIGEKWDEWGPQITGAVTAIADKASQLKDTFTSLGQTIADNQPLLIGLAITAGVIATAIAAITSPVLAVIGVIAALAAGVLWLWNNFDTFHNIVVEVFTWLQANVPTAVNVVQEAFAKLVEILQPLVNFIVQNKEEFANIGKVLLVVAAVILGVVVAAIVTVIAWLAGLIAILAAMALGIAAGIAVMYNFAQVVWDVFNNVRDALGMAIDWIENLIQTVWDMAQNVANALDQVHLFFTTLPGKILSAIGDLGTLLWDSGTKLIEGLVNGFMSKVGEVKDKIGSALGSIRNLFPFSPAKEGPFSGTGWVSYSGASIARDFAASIAAGTGGVRDAATRLMGAAALNGGGGGLAGSLGAGGGGGGTHVHNWYVQGSIHSDRDLIRLVRDELTNKGFGG